MNIICIQCGQEFDNMNVQEYECPYCGKKYNSAGDWKIKAGEIIGGYRKIKKGIDGKQIIKIIAANVLSLFVLYSMLNQDGYALIKFFMVSSLILGTILGRLLRNVFPTKSSMSVYYITDIVTMYILVHLGTAYYGESSLFQFEWYLIIMNLFACLGPAMLASVI